ncbi:phage integrase SAM-like domain-containing protein [Aurantibacillus circumpalustris]|uniref:phage integrase SAM-like domain-containing protein n=1 Tax=Aurantibacillus circumpalustris TaxID=3036359 RepID=UPI0037C02A06
MQKLVERDEVASATLVKYFHTLKPMTKYMAWKYNVSGVDIRKVDHEFMTQFEFYLKTVKNCNDQTSVKYVKNLVKIINICRDNNWLTVNPFAKYKPKIKRKKPVPSMNMG